MGKQKVRKDEFEAATDKMCTLIMDGLNSPIGRPWSKLKGDLMKRAGKKRQNETSSITASSRAGY